MRESHQTGYILIFFVLEDVRVPLLSTAHFSLGMKYLVLKKESLIRHQFF